MAKLPKRTALDTYLLTKEIPYFRSEPFKLSVEPIWLESEKEWYRDPYVNADKFENYHKYLIAYKKTYDFIFEGLTDPIVKAGLKQKICSKLNEVAQYPNYPYIDLITDLLEQINNEYDLYKKGLKKVVSDSEQGTKKQSLKEIALIYVYEGKIITRENANQIAVDFGHNSGEKLYHNFTTFSNRTDRKADPESKIKLLNKIKLFESVIMILSEKAKPKALAEMEILKSFITKY